MMKQEREYYIDALKGLGILLVIIGHSLIFYKIKVFIYLFHMPLFFILSGYFAKSNYNLFHNISKNANSLVYPYFTLGILVIIYNTLLDYYFIYNSFNMQMLQKRIIALIYGNYIWESNFRYIGTLWFLVALFSAVNIYYLLIKVINNDYMRSIASIAILLIGGWYTKNFKSYRLPFCLDVALVAQAFYFLGYYLNKFKILKKINLFFSIILFVFGLGLGYYNNIFYLHISEKVTHVDMLYMSYGNVLLFYLSASLIVITLMKIFNSFYQFKIKFNALEKIGRLSLLIMVIHLYIMQIITKLVRLLEFNYVNIVISQIVGSLVISYFLALVVDKKVKYIYKKPNL